MYMEKQNFIYIYYRKLWKDDTFFDNLEWKKKQNIEKLSNSPTLNKKKLI